MALDFIFKNADCLVEMQKLPDESINCILTDPPYKYLKNQKLEVDFDEDLFFTEAKRVLKPNGFIVLFGRGTSFYRWNTMLDKLGFLFKEEIIWDKLQPSSPMNQLMRYHETISIHAKGNAMLNKVKRPITEAYAYEPKKIIQSIYRLETTFGNRKTFDLIKKYFETGIAEYDEGKPRVFDTTLKSDIKKRNRTLQFAVSMEEGITERSIFKETRDYYEAIHPTQKPVKLIERLLALTTKKNDIVLDAFAGSCSTGIACRNMNRSFIGFEIDEEYYNKARERIKGKIQTVLKKPKRESKKINYGQIALNFD